METNKYNNVFQICFTLIHDIKKHVRLIKCCDKDIHIEIFTANSCYLSTKYMHQYQYICDNITWTYQVLQIRINWCLVFNKWKTVKSKQCKSSMSKKNLNCIKKKDVFQILRVVSMHTAYFSYLPGHVALPCSSFPSLTAADWHLGWYLDRGKVWLQSAFELTSLQLLLYNPSFLFPSGTVYFSG